jgi:hypothetical protein
MMLYPHCARDRWIRALWLAAWQCWLAVVSPRVARAFVPDAARIAAIARQVREFGADSGRASHYQIQGTSRERPRQYST